MHKKRLGASFIAFSLSAAAFASLAVPVASRAAEATYVGSESCQGCHEAKYNDFAKSAHPYKLMTPQQAQAKGLPIPDGYVWDDIAMVIGGSRWKSRYMDHNGYVITKTGPNKDIPGKNQYNVLSKTWVDYEAGKVKKYDCGPCHNTGYSASGNQWGKPGIVGTWALNGVQCEACHGPASLHVSSSAADKKSTIKIDRSAASCGACHMRGTDSSVIPAQGGFIRHHEQYQEFLAGPHSDKNCVACHDPHKSAATGSTKPGGDCASCHAGQGKTYASSSLAKAGVTCDDCHMAKAMKSADSFGPWVGDVKSHLFRIDTDPEAKMFNEAGTAAVGKLTLGFACLSCHEAKDATWAAEWASLIHLDTDKDGLTDFDEKRLGTDPTDADTDGDLFGDGAEVAGKSDPLNPLSIPLPGVGEATVPIAPPFSEIPVLDDQEPIS